MGLRPLNGPFRDIGEDVFHLADTFKTAHDGWLTKEEPVGVDKTIRGVGKLQLTYSHEYVVLNWATNSPKHPYDVYTVLFTPRGKKDSITLFKCAAFPKCKRADEYSGPISEQDYKYRTTTGYTDTTVGYTGNGYYKDVTVNSSYLILDIYPEFSANFASMNAILDLAEPAWAHSNTRYFQRNDGETRIYPFFESDLAYTYIHPAHRYWINMSNIIYDGANRMPLLQAQISSYLTDGIKHIIDSIRRLDSEVYTLNPDNVTHTGIDIRKYLLENHFMTSPDLLGTELTYHMLARAATTTQVGISAIDLELGSPWGAWAFSNHDKIKIDHAWLYLLYMKYMLMREDHSPMYQQLSRSILYLPTETELYEVYDDLVAFIKKEREEERIQKRDATTDPLDKKKLTLAIDGLDI